MVAEPRIRAATDADVEAIARLLTELTLEFIAPELSEEGRSNLLASMEPAALRANLASGFDVLVAVTRTELAGPGGSAPGSSERIVGVVATRDDTHLFHLFVARAFHRRGLARRLWDAARERCVERAGTRRFTVFASSYARAAYGRLGFREAGPVDVRGGVTSYPMELVLE